MNWTDFAALDWSLNRGRRWISFARKTRRSATSPRKVRRCPTLPLVRWAKRTTTRWESLSSFCRPSAEMSWWWPHPSLIWRVTPTDRSYFSRFWYRETHREKQKTKGNEFVIVIGFCIFSIGSDQWWPHPPMLSRSLQGQTGRHQHGRWRHMFGFAIFVYSIGRLNFAPFIDFFLNKFYILYFLKNGQTVWNDCGVKSFYSRTTAIYESKRFRATCPSVTCRPFSLGLHQLPLLLLLLLLLWRRSIEREWRRRWRRDNYKTTFYPPPLLQYYKFVFFFFCLILLMII